MTWETCQHYIVGVSIGKPTAIAVIEQELEASYAYGSITRAMRLRHLERTQESYPQITERLKKLLHDLKGREGDEVSDLVVDVTGSGSAVAVLMREAELSPIVVYISGGGATGAGDVDHEIGAFISPPAPQIP